MIGITRSLKRLTTASIHSCGKRRAVVVSLAPATASLVGFRLAGTRTTYYLPVDWCFREAVRADLARKRAERKAAREKKRKESA